jgi:hypothetical protein
MFAEVVPVLLLVAGNDTDVLRDLVRLCCTCKDFALLLSKQFDHFSVLRHWCTCLKVANDNVKKKLTKHVQMNGARVHAALQAWSTPTSNLNIYQYHAYHHPGQPDLDILVRLVERIQNCGDKSNATIIRLDKRLLQEVKIFTDRHGDILFPIPALPGNEDDNDTDDDNVFEYDMVLYLTGRCCERVYEMRRAENPHTEEERVREIRNYRLRKMGLRNESTKEERDRIEMMYRIKYM